MEGKGVKIMNNMALNITVPMPAHGGLSSISPLGMESWENLKILVSPIGSESSGVSSLDSEDIKVRPMPSEKQDEIKRDLRIFYNGRNVLDLYKNVETNSTNWNFRYSHLPERNNISMFWANRSLYNRLGPNGLTPVYTINKCECCDFQYTSDCPNSNLSETSLILSTTTTSPMIFTTAASKTPEYHISKMTSALQQPISNLTSFPGYKNDFDFNNKEFCSQNKPNYNDMGFKKTSNLTSNNNGIYNNNNNISKHNNKIIRGNRNTTELYQLDSDHVAINKHNSPTNTPPLNLMLSYGSNNVMHTNNNNGCNEQLVPSNSKCNAPLNIFNNNNSLTLPSLISPANNTNHSYHNSNLNANNNAILNNNNVHNFSNSNGSNRSQSFSSNNLYSLFNNSGNSNHNTTNYVFNNANGTSNQNNMWMNSPNSMNTSTNSSNTLQGNSQHYGRMYKYF